MSVDYSVDFRPNKIDYIDSEGYESLEQIVRWHTKIECIEPKRQWHMNEVAENLFRQKRSEQIGEEKKNIQYIETSEAGIQNSNA